MVSLSNKYSTDLKIMKVVLDIIPTDVLSAVLRIENLYGLDYWLDNANLTKEFYIVLTYK